MKTIHDVSPLMPVAPTVRIGDQVMVESGAIIELILARAGHGRLEPAVNSPDYPYYLQWMHFAEGSFAARAIARLSRGADPRQTQDAGRRLQAGGYGSGVGIHGRLFEQASLLRRIRIFRPPTS